AVARAVAARARDAAAGGAARDAGRGGDDLAEDGAAALAHLARTVAHVATRGVCSRLAPGPSAPVTGDGQADLDGGGGAERGVGEREVRDDLGVGGAWRTGGAPVAERVAAEERVE